MDITGDTVLQTLPSGEFLVAGEIQRRNERQRTAGNDKEHTYYLTAATEQERMVH